MNIDSTTTRHDRAPLARRLTAWVLSGVLVGGALIATAEPAQVAAVDSAPTLTAPVATTATTATLPRTARGVGSIRDWRVAAKSVFAGVGPEVGSVKSGSVALSVDAPVVAATRSAAWTTVRLVAGEVYTFEAHVRLLSKTRTSVPAHFLVGDTTVKIPALNARWQKVTATFTAGATQTSAKIVLRVSGAVRGLSVDSVRLAATSGATAGVNVVPNPSFENVDAARGIVSTSLVMTTPTAAAAVALPKGATHWAVYRAGKRVAKHSATLKGQMSGLTLRGVPQGLFTLKVVASDKKVYRTSIAVIDSPTPWVAQDKRFGAALHVEEWKLYADAGRHTRALGLSSARNDIFWGAVERKKGTYDFGPYDDAFARLRANGVSLLGIAGYGNSAYGTSNRYAPRTSAAVKAYGKYAAALAKRYPMVGLEVFNEFNWPDHNKSDCRSSTCYLRLVKSVQSAVGKVKPSLPIVVGGTAKYQPAWFDNLWKQGALPYADAMSFHPYEITGHPEDLAGIIRQARASMKKHAGKTKPIWISELGTSAATGNRTHTEQASILLRSSVTALAGGARKFYWYELINSGSRAGEHMHNFGLYAYPKKGVAAPAPKRAGFVQALTVAQLGGRSFRSTQSLGNGILSHGFGTSGNLVRVVWTPSGTKAAKIKSSSPIVLVKMDGTKKTVRPKNGVVTFAATKNPVFVRSGAATAGVTK